MKVKKTQVGPSRRNIEAKERCLRVQFLDWLSDKLLDWSNRVHVVSSKIDSPCLIEVIPRTKEESKSAKENKEITRLKEQLQNAYEREDAAHARNRELTQAHIEEVKAILEKANEVK